MPRATRASWRRRRRSPASRRRGIIPTSTNAVLCEVQRTWNRPDAAQYAELYGLRGAELPAVAESYQKAQEAGQPKNERLQSPGGPP